MKYVVEFIKEGHIYLINGVIKPSATGILTSTLFKDKYKGVNEEVMKRAAEFGNNVHEAIELEANNDLTYLEETKYLEWKELELEHTIIPTSKEQIVNFKDVYAGTYDMEAWVLGEHCLLDVKTTYELDVEYISWQLSLYAFARGVKFDKFYAIWLPRRKKGGLVEIPQKTDAEVLALLELYKKEVEDNE